MDIHTLLKEKEVELKLYKREFFNNRILLSREKNTAKVFNKAKAAIMHVGKETQKEIKTYIEETVTLALQSVYGEDYSFVVEFSYTKRDQFEVYFFVSHCGVLLEPRKDTCGGGVVDVCAFALRIIWLTLEESNISMLLILDEPFKNVSASYIPTVGGMVTDISKLLGIQIIMVTHIEGFIEAAENIIYIGEDHE